MKVRFSGNIETPSRGYHKSCLHVNVNETSSRVTILANQPVYPSSNGDGFELDPLGVAKDMCYPPFDYFKVICHDLRNGRALTKEIEGRLSSLENLEE